jgi:RNA 2',3'-cyclic 3'-phosphodiesterase
MIRLFTAIAVPPEIGDGLMTRQHGLLGARWRPREAFHITLRFYGEVSEDRAADLDEALAGLSGTPLDLELTGVGAFGEGPEIHAVWAGVAVNAGLTRLAKQCEAAARRAGMTPEHRRYVPHVTLAYLSRPDPNHVAQWINANGLLHSPKFQTAKFGLYSSWRTSEGSAYRLEQEYELDPAT